MACATGARYVGPMYLQTRGFAAYGDVRVVGHTSAVAMGAPSLSFASGEQPGVVLVAGVSGRHVGYDDDLVLVIRESLLQHVGALGGKGSAMLLPRNGCM